MSDVFLGNDDLYRASTINSPKKLGMVLRYLFPAETNHYGDPRTGVFMWLAVQTSVAAHELEQGGNEPDIVARLDHIVRDMIDRLCGDMHLSREGLLPMSDSP